MKVKRYAVSIQWGQGQHYFVRTDIDTLSIAAAERETRVRALARRKSRHNLVPSVYIWERV